MRFFYHKTLRGKIKNPELHFKKFGTFMLLNITLKEKRNQRKSVASVQSVCHLKSRFFVQIKLR